MVKLIFKLPCEFTETKQHACTLHNCKTPVSQNFFPCGLQNAQFKATGTIFAKLTWITFVSGQPLLSSQYLSYSWRWFPRYSSVSTDPPPWLVHPESPPWIPPGEQWQWIISSSSPRTGCQPACDGGCTAQSPSKSCKTEGKQPPKVILQASFPSRESENTWKNCSWKWKPAQVWTALLSGHSVESPCCSVVGILI